MTELLVAVVPKPGQVQELRPGGSLTERLEDRLDEISDAIHQIGYQFRDKLNDMFVTPSQPAELEHDSSVEEIAKVEDRSSSTSLSEIELAFSLELQAEAGVIVAKGSASAGLEVSLTWRREQSQ